MYSIEQVLGYVPLTRAIKTVASGIPKVLPEKFYTPSPGARVMGNKARNISFAGTRKVARVTPYGAPPRQVVQLPRSSTDVRLLHSTESIAVEQELLMLLRKLETYEAQVMAADEIRFQAQEYRQRFDNLRVAAITSMVAHGKLWFDADGNLQNSSSGADLEIDYGVPATNRNQINPGSGAIISASWATSTTNIVTQVNNLKKYAIQKTGYPLKYALYGANIAGYLTNNDHFKYYLARNPGMNQRHIDTGRLDGEYLELTWIPVYNAFYEDEDGTIVEVFPADQVVFTPDLTEDIYQLYEGGYPVPKSIQMVTDLEQALSNVAYEYGQYGYAYMEPPNRLMQVYGDTFLPRWMNPNAIFMADVTP